MEKYRFRYDCDLLSWLGILLLLYLFWVVKDEINVFYGKLLFQVSVKTVKLQLSWTNPTLAQFSAGDGRVAKWGTNQAIELGLLLVA